MEKSDLTSLLASFDLSAMVRGLRESALGQGEPFMQYRTIGESDLDALLSRIADVKNIGLGLDSEDVDLILNIVQSYAHMREKLKDHKVTVNHLRKELGIKPKRESLKELSRELEKSQNFADDTEFTLDDPPVSEEPSKPTENKKSDSHSSSKKAKSELKPSKRNGKRSAEDFEKAKSQLHALTHVKSGEACSHCAQGKFYKYEPAQFIRISGQAPLQATQHISERMRCNACGIYETAPLSAEVLADGEPGQMYGYSARSVMAIHKFLAGHPYHRQESLSEIMGCPVSASTIFEQCEALADSVQAVHGSMLAAAPSANQYDIDDTRNRILDAEPRLLNKRNAKGQSLRTGVFTSTLIATLPIEKTIVLYKTNIGHAGELIDSILTMRPKDLAPPLVMSDALSWNIPSACEVIHSLCMVHARRQFCDIFEEDSQACSEIIAKMDKFFEYDRAAKSQGLDAKARLGWHQEYSLPILDELKSSFTEAMLSKKVESNSNMGGAMISLKASYEWLS